LRMGEVFKLTALTTRQLEWNWPVDSWKKDTEGV
jgi:hypothetical protein